MRLRWLFSLMIAVHFANSASSRCSDIAVFLHEHAKGTGDQIWAYVVVRPYSASQILVGLRWFQTIGNADIYAMWSESTHRKGNVTVTDEESWPITGFENTQVLIPIKAESHQFSISMNSSLGYTTFFNYSFVQGMPQINMPNQLCIHETKQNYDACLCCEHEPPSSFCPNVIADEPMACQQFQNTLSLNSLSGFFYGAYRFDRTGYFGTQDMDILHNDPLSLLFFTTVFFNGNQVNPTAFGCKNNCWYALPSDSLTSVLHIRVQVSFIGIIFKHTAAEFYLNQKGDVFRNGRMKYSDMYTPQNPCYTSDKRCLCCYHFLMDTQCYDPSSPLPTPPIEYSSTVLMTSATISDHHYNYLTCNYAIDNRVNNSPNKSSSDHDNHSPNDDTAGYNFSTNFYLYNSNTFYFFDNYRGYDHNNSHRIHDYEDDESVDDYTTKHFDNAYHSITGSTTPMSSSIQTTTEMLTTTTVLTTTTESQSCLSSPSCSGLYNISHTPVTPHTIHRIIRNVTANIKHRSVNLTGDDIYYISIIVSRIASSGPLTDKVFDDVSTVIDLTLEAQKEQFDDSDEQQRGSTERILDSIDIMMKNSNGTVKYLTGNNFALAARNPDCSGLTKNDDGLADYLTRFDYVSRDVQKSTDPSASITIPLSTICSANVDRVYYAIYRNTKLFVPAGEVSKRKKRSASPEEAVTPPPKNRCKHGKFMNDGRVLTATALKKSAESFEKLSMYNDATTQSEATMAILSYSDKDKLQPLHGKFAVSWWKDSSYWSSDLCNVETTSHGYEAHCTHLTDFTLIVDGLLTEPCLCDNNLVILGYAMGSFSLLGLLFLGVLYCSNYSKLLRDMDLIRKLRGNPSATANDAVSVLYIFTMLLFYLSFTFFSDKAIAGSACNTLAGVNYWLLLSCLTFTMCQSLRTLRVFAWSKIMEKVLYFMTRDYIVIGLSYGVSSIVVITFATTITNFFKREDDYCWIRPDWVIVSVVVPLSILVICGIVCFALIIMRLFPNIFKRYSSRGSSRALHRTKNYLKRKIVAILLMQFSLGIPWVFQYLTLFSPQVTVWHYLFTIVNGSQGVTLFLLYLYRRILLQRQKRQSKKLTSSYASSKSREQRQRAHSEFYQHFD
ncbi:hypothetical protein QR680_000598 [Steinernema hermaphroditum]|uniref:G-protein coupled receptors family 2 profile 2 domain-containing protein n=1 Tax=Steinernema hermaphroditum TaxID=289476 RepID=A0AA39GV69_9BILA|nr:hypothetical protein QR680_000598 [Steinernema hermaphroditum]